MGKERVSGVDIWYFDASSSPTGHIMAPMGNMPPGTTVAFVRVKSIDEVTRKVKKNRGKVIAPKYEVPGRGWFAWYQAPGGLVQAVFQPKRKVRK